MTTVQEPLTNAIPPFPFFIENPAELNRTELPANKANNNQFASDDQVVERQKGVSPRESHGDQELSRVTKSRPPLAHEKVHIHTDPLPDRCQFFFSDGRQCSMARSDIHPSLCRFHSEREEQLFGDPAPGGNVVGRALDLPELYSACRDLTTASGVNRALGQVFRLLAQRRISRQEGATFGHLAQLLLRTISLMRAESADPTRFVVPSEQRDSRDLSPSARGNKVTAAGPHSDLSGLRPPGAGPVAVPPAPRADSSREATEGRNPRTISTSAAFVSNSSEINTSENAESEAVQNEHLQKSGPGGHRRERHPRRERLPTG